MTMTHAVCHLCPNGCPVWADVRNGKLVSAKRKPAPGVKKRRFCPKVHVAAEIVYSPERITTPMLRRNGRNSPWRPATWDEALTRAADGMLAVKADAGAQALGWLKGTGIDWSPSWDYAIRLMHAFGSPNIWGNGALCHVTRDMAQVRTHGAMTVPDYANSDCILVWGANVKDSSPPNYDLLMKARKRGAKLIVADPVRTDLAAAADIFLQVKPGGDGLLAMAMIHVLITEELFDRDFVDHWCMGFDALRQAAPAYSPERIAPAIWLDPESIRRAARMYATTRPACMADGNGVEMNLNVSQNARAMSILRSLTGNLDRKGGDLFPARIPFRDLRLKERLAPQTVPISHEYPLFNRYEGVRGDPLCTLVTDAILEEKPYPLRGLIIQAVNPAVTLPNTARVIEALKKLDLVVAIDLFMTRTAEHADVFLPAATSFESTRLKAGTLAAGRAVLQDKIIDPVGESRPDWQIEFDLARRLGLGSDFPWKSIEACIDEQLAPSGLTVARLRAAPDGIEYAPRRYENYRRKGFNTPSGKVELYVQRYRDQGQAPIPVFEDGAENRISFHDQRDRYPLLGISGARSGWFVHTRYRNIASLVRHEPRPLVDIHPRDAQSRGIADADPIAIRTPNGSLKMWARVSDAVRPGSVRIPWGWGQQNPEWDINRLTDDLLRDPISGTTSSTCFMCQVQGLG